MPATAERDEMILKARQNASNKCGPVDEDYEARQAVKVATETVSGLQVRLPWRWCPVKWSQRLGTEGKVVTETGDGR